MIKRLDTSQFKVLFGYKSIPLFTVVESGDPKYALFGLISNAESDKPIGGFTYYGV